MDLGKLKLGSSELLLSRLREVQKKHGHCPEAELERISREMGIPLSDVYAVVFFYAFLKKDREGRNVVRVCRSPSCFVNGAERNLEILKSRLGVDIEETTHDKEFTLEVTSCIGHCEEAPAMLVNDNPEGKVTEEKIAEILERCKS